MLVNNAGFATFGPFAQVTTESRRKIMTADLDAVYFGARSVAPSASEDARFVNGVILPVDDGLGASHRQPNFLILFGQG